MPLVFLMKLKGGTATAMGPKPPGQVNSLKSLTGRKVQLRGRQVTPPGRARLSRGVGSGPKRKPALVLACNLWKLAQPPVQHLKKPLPPISPVLLSVEGLVHCHLLTIKDSEVLFLGEILARLR